MTVSNQPRVWPTVPDRNDKTKRSMGTGCDRIISYGYYCDHYNTHNYSASRAERFSREPLKPVVTIGKLLSFTAYYIIIYIIHIPRRIHEICTRHAYTTALANTNICKSHLLAIITYVLYSNNIMYIIRYFNNLCSG